MISQGPSMCVFNKEDPQVVLASWLFAQFMLTDKVQIAYAQTEGYVPVTEKAKNTNTYQDYLNRSGEDNELYYNIKLDATKLLLDNTENTFVTSVFNGSASLRDAAGQLIEETKKAARRGDTIDDAYMQALFAEMTSLYRLDQLNTGAGGKVAMIFQDPMTCLNPTKPVGKQIVEAIQHHRKLSSEEAKKEAIKYLKMVKIPNAEERAKQYPHEFSGGMRQRVMIAIALACTPELIIADEPTGNLDPARSLEIMMLLEQINTLGTTVMVVTHARELVNRFTKRVIVIDDGEVVSDGMDGYIYE